MYLFIVDNIQHTNLTAEYPRISRYKLCRNPDPEKKNLMPKLSCLLINYITHSYCTIILSWHNPHFDIFIINWFLVFIKLEIS